MEWVDWFNNRRLLEPIGNTPPAEAEERYAMLEEPAMAACLKRNGLRKTRRGSSLTSDKSYQIDSSIALNKASGGQAGSPFEEQEITQRA